MISKVLLNTLEDKGFIYSENSESDRNSAYKICNGYLVTVYEKSNKNVIYFNFKFADTEENALKRYDISQRISVVVERYSITDYTIDSMGITVITNGDGNTVIKIVETISNLLNELEIRNSAYCSKCGNKFGTRTPKRVNEDVKNYLMCEHCAMLTIENAKKHNLEETSADRLKSKVRPGVLGSVLFGFIGAIVFLLFYCFVSPLLSDKGIGDLRYIYCAIGTLISYLSYLGYRTFCKEVSVAAYVTIPIVSLLFTALGQYLGIVFEFVANNDLSLSVLSKSNFWLVHLRNTVPAEIVDNFPDYSGVFYTLLVISLLFSLVGSGIFLLSMRDRSKIKEQNVVVENFEL